MDNKTIRRFDPKQLVAQKQQQRQTDIAALKSGRLSPLEIQQQNSIFSGIDWSEVTVFEEDGDSWQPV